MDPPEAGEDQHFCCTSVDLDDKDGRGDGCTAISKENINACNSVLYCDGKWLKQDGTVKCL